jgi:long-chain acyl-CoA synthetase
VETGAITLNMDPNPEATAESVGIPLPGINVKIIDDDGKPLPSGTVGNVAVQSPGVGELCHADDRSALQLANGWIRMNDLGRIDEEGRLYITGRTETIINVAGQKVLPGEVETVLISHPAVKQVTVVPIRDAYGEEAVTAFVVACEQCTKTELLNHCRAQLADHKIPRFVEFRDSLP